MISVARVRLHEVALPLREPFAISGGTLRVRRSLIVELTDSAGNRGYGESAPFEQPFYSSETIASARACLAEVLLPRLLGVPVAEPGDARELLELGVRGNRMAKAGAETAWWDLVAAGRDVSLGALVAERLGARGRDHIECGVALGIPPDYRAEVLGAWVADALERGYRRIKLKVRPGWDLEPVATAREAMRAAGREVPLWVDANGAYRLDQDLDALHRLDREGLLFFEQPFPEDALWDSREAERHLRTPVCLDESLVSDDVARQVLAMAGPRIWNIKIQRVGGLEEACRIYQRALGAGVKLWGGTMPESGVGAQAMLALGGHAGFQFPSDIEPSARWYAPESDLIELTMDRDGRMAVPARRPLPRLPPDATLISELTV